jgi:hypothetical protein
MKRYVSNFQSSCLLGRFRLSRLSVAYMTNRDEYTDVELLIGRSLNRVLRLDSAKKQALIYPLAFTMLLEENYRCKI